ncbi:peptidoglycan/LPS O-acetylase OafA/YrhL [Paraburkholderia sp. GAS199]|uniref:acyltransferase family protein n=1 Tax=Paraburkholderia sp. GAS199 TaxID=3035126 RepID=UPI003D1E1ACF
MRPALTLFARFAGLSTGVAERAPDNRIAVLDAARAFAIVGVIAVHLGLWMPALPPWLNVVSELGQYGVQLFFVISAVTVSYTLEADERRYGASLQIVARRFYIKRFVRIAPLYYAAIVVYGVLDYLAHLAHGQITLQHHASDVMANLLFIHGWLPTSINSVVPGGWSIGVEMSFYALAPFVLYASRTARGLWMTGLLMLICGASIAVMGACSAGVQCHIENNEFFYFWLPVQVPCFVFGLWLARFGMPLLTGSRRLPWRALLALVLAGFACLTLVYEFGAGAELAHGLAPSAAGLAAVCMLIVASHLPVRWLKAPLVASFGQQSYGVYLWSAAAVALVRALLKTPVGTALKHFPTLGFLFALALVSALSYAAALVTTRWIDRPCGAWARRLLLAHGTQDARRHPAPGAGGEPVE